MRWAKFVCCGGCIVGLVIFGGTAVLWTFGIIGKIWSFLLTYLWPAIVWISKSNIAILVYNIILGYIFAFAAIGIGYLLVGSENVFNKKVFQMISFASREELQSTGFFEANNLQNEGIFKYPQTPQDYLDQVNHCFKTAITLCLIITLAMAASVGVTLMPNSLYLMKSIFYLMITLFGGFLFLELLSMKFFDFIIIPRIPSEPEVAEIVPPAPPLNPHIQLNAIDRPENPVGEDNLEEEDRRARMRRLIEVEQRRRERPLGRANRARFRGHRYGRIRDD